MVGKDLGSFIKSLTNADEAEHGTLTLDIDPKIGYDFGLPLFRGETKVKFCIRQEYSRIWGSIESKFEIARKSKFIITGTSGIGKSLFRLYILRIWLKGEVSMNFERAVMNFDNDYYLIDRKGYAKKVEKDHIIYKDSLALLDPCDVLHGVAKLRAKLTILTASCSYLAGQIKSCDLSQFKKFTPTFVMKLWSDVEVTYLGSIDQHRLVLFSYRDGDTASCVPQWFQIDDDEVLQCLDDAMSETSREGMAAWMTSNEAESKMPGCHCVSAPLKSSTTAGQSPASYHPLLVNTYKRAYWRD